MDLYGAITPKHKHLDLVFFTQISKEEKGESSGSGVYNFQWEVRKWESNAEEVDLEETSGGA